MPRSSGTDWWCTIYTNRLYDVRVSRYIQITAQLLLIYKFNNTKLLHTHTHAHTNSQIIIVQKNYLETFTRQCTDIVRHYYHTHSHTSIITSSLSAADKNHCNAVYQMPHIQLWHHLTKHGCISLSSLGRLIPDIVHTIKG